MKPLVYPAIRRSSLNTSKSLTAKAITIQTGKDKQSQYFETSRISSCFFIGADSYATVFALVDVSAGLF